MKKNIELSYDERFELRFMVMTSIKNLKNDISSNKEYLKDMSNGRFEYTKNKYDICEKVINQDEKDLIKLENLLKKLED